MRQAVPKLFGLQASDIAERRIMRPAQQLIAVA
jgi:hypothetical protein